jgi:hypothetical protein
MLFVGSWLANLRNQLRRVVEPSHLRVNVNHLTVRKRQPKI